MHALNRPLTLVTVLFITVFIATGANAQSTDDMLTQYMATVNANMPPNLDAEAIAKLYAEDAVHGHPMGASPNTDNPMTGRDKIKDFFSGFNSYWTDWTHIEAKRTVQGRHAVWEGIAKGTHKDSGKPVSVPIAFSIEFNDDGAVSKIDVYLNGGQIAAQLE